MPETQFNWADQIEAAKSADVGFVPLAPGTYNFEVTDPELKTFDNSGDTVINYKAKVLTGEREGNTMYDTLNPFAPADKKFQIKLFLDLFQAVGFTPDVLIKNNPSLQDIANAINGRKFTADVTESKKINPKTQKPYTNLGNYRPLESETAAEAPAATGFGTPPTPTTPAATGFGDAPTASAPSWGTPPDADAGNPWSS